MSLGLSLSKGISMSLYSKAAVTFDGKELKSSSDISTRIYSASDIAERAMLCAVLFNDFRIDAPMSFVDVGNS
jgi:hypothetical protein